MNTEILELAKQSDSAIIVLIVVLIGAVLTLMPAMKMWINAQDKIHEREIKQQDKLLVVIQANTEVNASLKTVLEEDRRFCTECRREQSRMFGQLQDNQDVANLKLFLKTH